jgi:hypothetical protein
VSDDTLGNIKVLKWPELPQTSDEHNIDGLIAALLEAETAEQIIECRNELLTAWMGRQARGAQQEPVGYIGAYTFIALSGGETVVQSITPSRVFNNDVAIFTSPPPQPDSVPREPTAYMIEAGVMASSGADSVEESGRDSTLHKQAADELDRLTTELAAAIKVQEVGKAFHDLVVKERDFERIKNDRLTAQLAAATATIKDLTLGADGAKEAYGTLIQKNEDLTKELARVKALNQVVEFKRIKP